jgi:hypothetical protein
MHYEHVVTGKIITFFEYISLSSGEQANYRIAEIKLLENERNEL